MIMTWGDVERADENAMITTKPLAWLLKFMQMDLNNLTELERVNLSLELQAFLLLTLTRYKLSVSRPALKRIGHRGPVESLASRPLAAETLASTKELRDFQGLARKWVEAFVKKEHLMIPVGPKWLHVIRNTKEGWTDASPTMLSSEDDFLWNLGHVLGQEGMRVKVCQDSECKRYFAGRPNQKFCSTKCQSRWTTRQQRDREKKGKRPPRRRRRKRRK